MRDYIIINIKGIEPGIKRLAIRVDNFENKLLLIQTIQQSVQFRDLVYENLNSHIAKFLEICDTFKRNGVLYDAIRLRLFSFSLRDGSEKLASFFTIGFDYNIGGNDLKFLR